LEKKKIRGDLRKKIIKFCDEENEHKLKSQKRNDNHGGTFLFKLITKKMTRLAIKISKKI
jgi:demethoxyubiquinone hydroxylase (CLK1/Coq7/Cat5 family)